MKTETIKKITTALLLGAVGSGLWSLAGEPAFRWCVDIFISIAQSLNDGYYDLMHVNVGKGLHEENGLFFKTIFNIVFSALVIFLPFMAHKLQKRTTEITHNKKREKEDIEKSLVSLKKRSRALFIFTVLYSIVAFPVIASRVITQGYNNKAVVFIERSIEILSPELSHEEIIRFRADYRAISDAESFYKVFDNLNSIAKKNKIALSEFDVAR